MKIVRFAFELLKRAPGATAFVGTAFMGTAFMGTAFVATVFAGTALHASVPASAFESGAIFAKIDPAHLALKATDFPGAPAVMLEKRGELRLASTGHRSTLDVSVRLKVLSEAGLAYGQVALNHGGGVDLVALEGRTIQPDGRVVPLPRDAVFSQATDTDQDGTTLAFPALRVGAIVDYRFRIAWDAPFFPQTWQFDDAIPTLLNELVYVEPPALRLRHHLRRTGRARYEVTEEASSGGRRVTIRLENAPPVTVEPRGFPIEDLAHAAWIVTESIRAPSGDRALNADWRSVVERYRPGYEAARRFGRQAQRRARRMIADARAKTATERIGPIFRFVRDEIEVIAEGLSVRPDRTVDDVLTERRGTSAEVALLLATMLESVDVPATLIWAADWRDGMPWLDVPRPGWFSKVLVRARIDGANGGGHLDLDPGDRRLMAGRLAPVTEGTDALLLAPGAPRVVRLPKTPADRSARDATLEMTLDEDGRLSATGRLTLTGHHAWFFLRRRDSEAATVEGWRRWLTERFEGFEVASPTVVESVDEQRIDIAWRMTQHRADVLGDEATIEPSVPLGPIAQRYALAPEDRTTPVRVSFADRDHVVLDLSWPPGWAIELRPEDLEMRGEAGAVSARLEVDATSRRLRYERTLSIDDTVYFPGAPYAALRALYGAVDRHDAQPIVLYRDE